MSKLRVNVENLKEAEFLLSAADPGLDQLRGELQDILNNLESSWSGDAANIYKNRIYEYIAVIDMLQPVINELKKYTENVRSTMEILDVFFSLNPIVWIMDSFNNSGGGSDR